MIGCGSRGSGRINDRGADMRQAPWVICDPVLPHVAADP